jgi:outer membrane protein assembly factor BamB
MKRLTISIIVLALSSITINAQNWPAFRGANASGVAEGAKPPVTWDVEKSTNVLWRTAIPGLSHASPIVWGNQIYLITAVSADAKAGFIAKDRGISLSTDNAPHTWMIYALDKQSGKILWSNKAYEGVPRAKRHVKATQANSTPVTDGRYVVALFGSEGLNCYDTKGKLLWKQDLGVLNPGLWDDKESSWGHSSSPVIYRDLVIVQADGHKQSFIAAFNLKDGKQAWRVERNEITSWATPTIYQGKDRTELIVNGGRYIRGYDPLSGKELWRFSDNDTQVKMQAPLIAHGLIYITGGYPPGRAMYAFRPGAVATSHSNPAKTRTPFSPGPPAKAVLTRRRRSSTAISCMLFPTTACSARMTQRRAKSSINNDCQARSAHHRLRPTVDCTWQVKMAMFSSSRPVDNTSCCRRTRWANR